MRYECDGYLDNSNSSPAIAAASLRSERSAPHNHDLASAFADFSFTTAVNDIQDRPLTIKSGGRLVPGSTLFDIKTRAAWKKGDSIWEAQVPRFWIRQIRNFIVGYHTRGVFDDIEVKEIGEAVEEWECENEEALKKLGNLLHHLATTVRETSSGRLEVRCNDENVFELREQCEDARSTLSSDLMTLWLSNRREETDSTSGSALKLDVNAEAVSEHEIHLSSEANELEANEAHERDWDSESEKDCTACSAASCGYCGHCLY